MAGFSHQHTFGLLLQYPLQTTAHHVCTHHDKDFSDAHNGFAVLFRKCFALLCIPIQRDYAIRPAPRSVTCYQSNRDAFLYSICSLERGMPLK